MLKKYLGELRSILSILERKLKNKEDLLQEMEVEEMQKMWELKGADGSTVQMDLSWVSSQDSLNAVQGNISEIQTNMSNLKSDIVEIKDEIDKLKSKIKDISSVVAPGPYEVAPDGEIDNWNYTLDPANNKVILGTYKGTDTDATIFNKYPVDGVNYNTEFITFSDTFKNKTALKTVTFGDNIDTSRVTNASYMFYGCTSIESIVFNDLNTSNVTNMNYMFYNCNKLKSVDIKNINTSNVTTMAAMFANCAGITSIDIINGFDTSKVTNMNSMFIGTSIDTNNTDFSKFNTSSVERITGIVPVTSDNELILTGLDLRSLVYSTYSGKIKIFNNTITKFKFNKCLINEQLFSNMKENNTNATSLTIKSSTIYDYQYSDGIDDFTEVATLLESLTLDDIIFSGYTNDVELGSLVGGYGTAVHNSFSHAYINNLRTDNDHAIYASMMFADAPSLTDVTISNIRVSSMHAIFDDCTSLSSVTFNNITTTESVDMESMFYKCSNIESIDLGGIDFSNVTSVKNMFYECVNLTSINLSNINISNITSFEHVFAGCAKLINIEWPSNIGELSPMNLSGMYTGCSLIFNNNTVSSLLPFDLSNITNMQNLFSKTNITEFNGFGKNINNNVDISNILSNCPNLVSVDLSSINVTNMTVKSLFQNDTSLINVIFNSNIVTSNVTDVQNMFRGCTALTSLDLTEWDTSGIVQFWYIFSNCTNLTEIRVSRDKWVVSESATTTGMFEGCGCSEVTYVD